MVMKWHFSLPLQVVEMSDAVESFSEHPRKILIVKEQFDPLTLQADYQVESMGDKTDYGATANFVGTMRDFNEGDDVLSMTLEHYPAMTSKQLDEIVDKSYQQWPIQNVLIVHRVGEIFPAESIVLVAVWSAHRNAAFDGCRYIMEALKHQAPFWKKEVLSAGTSRWVAENTKGK